ncbi:MAG: hypothetical protein QNJ89_11415, partial [Acidimicrobiia bacterium]|nr:hypothetical protein [Acidimicrobiia bacterium]
MALAATGVVALTPSSSVDPGGPTPESPVALSASPSNDRPLDPVGAALPPDSVIPDATPMIEIATADGHSPRADDSTLSAAQQYAAAVAAWSQCLGTASTQAELSELMQTCGPVPDISGFGVDDDGEVTLAAAEGDDPLGDDEGDDPPGDDEGDDPPGDDEADDPPADDPPADDPPADDPPADDPPADDPPADDPPADDPPAD